MRKSPLLPIFLVVFVDLLGFSLILPLLPYYAGAYGATPLVIGLLTASYAAAQLIGAPLLGRLSDRFGRRPILLASIGGTLAGFLLLAFADPLGRWLAQTAAPSAANFLILTMLFLSRIIDGLTGGNISVAQAYISDVTDFRNRAKGLGLIGAAFGLGFIIGPAIGGILSTWGYAVPAFAAAGLATLNLLSVYFLLPESLTPEVRSKVVQPRRASISLRALWEALNRERVGPLLHIRLFFGLAFSMFQSIFSIYAATVLGLDARSTGFVLAYVGILSVIVQGGGIALLTKRFGERELIVASLGVMSLSLFAWSLASTLPIMLVVITPMSLAGGVLNTVINSALSKSVYPEEVGGTLGLSASLESLTRVFAPSVGGVLLEAVGAWAPGLVTGLLVAWSFWFSYRRLVQCPDAPLPEREEALPETA